MSREYVVKAVLLLLAGALSVYSVSDHSFFGGGPGFGVAQALISVVGAVLAVGAMLPLRWSARILAAFTAFMLCLTAAELVCERQFGARFRPYFVEHEERIFTLRPSAEVLYLRVAQNGGDRILSRINRAGFRGPDLPSDALSQRVFVYGDSFIHAPYSREQDSFVHTLGRSLNDSSGRHIAAINAGVSSYGPDQILRRIASDLATNQIDLVVVAIFAGNDYGDLVRNRMSDLSPNGTLQARSWRLDPAISASLRLSTSSSMLMTLARRAVSNPGHRDGDLQMAARPFELMQSWLEEAQVDFRRSILERDVVVDNIYVDHYDADVALLPSSPSADHKRRLMHAVLEAIVSTTRARHLPIAFIVIPHPIDVCIDYDSAQVDLQRYPEYRRANLTEPIVTHLRKLGVPTLDLFSFFWTVGADALYFRAGDDHWNDAGQALAASEMARLVENEGLLAR